MLMRTDGRVHRRKSQRVANNVVFKPKKTSPPRPIVVGGQLHYEVETVLHTRGTRAGPVEYHVTWKGYPASANSWIRQLPAFFQTPRKRVLDDDSSSCSSGSGSSATDESVNKYVFGSDDDDGDSNDDGDSDDDEDSDEEALAPSDCPGIPSYVRGGGGGATHDPREDGTGAGGPTQEWVAQLLEEYKSEYDEYTFYTAYVFLHKQHRLAHRMFSFQTLREHANILASYANEDDEPTSECQQWNLSVDSGNPRLYSIEPRVSRH